MTLKPLRDWTAVGRRPVWRWRWLIAALTLVCSLPTAAQDSLDDAIHAALTDFNARPFNPIRYREAGRISDDTGAVVYAEVVNPQTDAPYPGVIDWVYVTRQTPSAPWRATFTGDARYRAVFLSLSEALRAQADDTPYRTQAVPDLLAAEALTDYQLPFPHGAFGTIVRSYGDHGTGKIDFDLQAREIAAVKDGEIVFASDRFNLTTFQSAAWWYWNVVIIQHGDHEYSLYGHLAQDSIPAWIRERCSGGIAAANCAVPVRAGDIIGLEGSTGYSTNPHLHLELGQGFGTVPYLDVLDGDGDGDRTEAIYAGYVYAEHNAAFLGYSQDETRAWPYLTVLQALHPQNPNPPRG
ncbi:MAG: M23 family metallopeptidase [bacterium]|nr:M23 family metallopeptidase [bacterium]